MTDRDIEPLAARSLKAQCLERLERLIISGKLAIGEAFPPERDLAKSLGVSRPVLHEAMVELAAKGFTVVKPRRGTRVADYYRNGTLAIFESIVLHGDGDFPRSVLGDLVAFRRLIESESVRLAAQRGGGEYLAELRAVVGEEEAMAARPAAEVSRRTDLDVRFHLLLAEASGNRVLPLVINSIAPLYRRLVERFYESSPRYGTVLAFHGDLVDSIAKRDPEGALRVLEAMLEHGARSMGTSATAGRARRRGGGAVSRLRGP